MLRCKYIQYSLRLFWYWFTILCFSGVLPQFALTTEVKHDYWGDYLLIPSLVAQPKQYLYSDLSATGNSLVSAINTRKVGNTTLSSKRLISRYSSNTGKIYSRIHSTSNGLDEKLLYFLDTLGSLNAKSLELQIGETIFRYPSFYSFKSQRLRLYSTSVDWQDPQYPEPIKLVLSVYRDRTIEQSKNIPSAMIVMYSRTIPTRERTIIGYGRYGVYGTLTLLWEDIEGFPGTSFFQFGVAYDSARQFQPLYDPDLEELTYIHQGQWIAAGWRTSDLSSLQTVAKYFYYILAGK